MENARPQNTETSAPDSLNSKQQPFAVQLLRYSLTDLRNGPQRPATMRKLGHLHIHHFKSVGGGMVFPVLYDGRPIFRPDHVRNDGDLSTASSLLLPDEGIDRKGLIFGHCFFHGPELSLTLESRREYLYRIYRVFRRFGFPYPNIPTIPFRKIIRNVCGDGGVR